MNTNPENIVALNAAAAENKRLIDQAYASIKDEAHIGSILDYIRDEDRNKRMARAEFDGQLARIIRNFPDVAGIVARLPGTCPEYARISLVAILQAISRIERLLLAEAYDDEIAAQDALPDNVIPINKEQAA